MLAWWPRDNARYEYNIESSNFIRFQVSTEGKISRLTHCAILRTDEFVDAHRLTSMQVVSQQLTEASNERPRGGHTYDVTDEVFRTADEHFQGCCGHPLTRQVLCVVVQIFVRPIWNVSSFIAFLLATLPRIVLQVPHFIPSIHRSRLETMDGTYIDTEGLKATRLSWLALNTIFVPLLLLRFCGMVLDNAQRLVQVHAIKIIYYFAVLARVALEVPENMDDFGGDIDELQVEFEQQQAQRASMAGSRRDDVFTFVPNHEDAEERAWLRKRSGKQNTAGELNPASHIPGSPLEPSGSSRQIEKVFSGTSHHGPSTESIPSLMFRNTGSSESIAGNMPNGMRHSSKEGKDAARVSFSLGVPFRRFSSVPSVPPGLVQSVEGATSQRKMSISKGQGEQLFGKRISLRGGAGVEQPFSSRRSIGRQSMLASSQETAFGKVKSGESNFGKRPSLNPGLLPVTSAIISGMSITSSDSIDGEELGLLNMLPGRSAGKSSSSHGRHTRSARFLWTLITALLTLISIMVMPLVILKQMCAFLHRTLQDLVLRLSSWGIVGAQLFCLTEPSVANCDRMVDEVASCFSNQLSFVPFEGGNCLQVSWTSLRLASRPLERMLKYRLNVRSGHEDMWNPLPLQVPASESRYLVYARLVPHVTYHFQLLASVGGKWRVVCEQSYTATNSPTQALDLPSNLRGSRNRKSGFEEDGSGSNHGVHNSNCDDLPGVVPLPREPCPDMVPASLAPRKSASFVLPDMEGPASKVIDNILDTRSLARIGGSVSKNSYADELASLQHGQQESLEQLVTGLLNEETIGKAPVKQSPANSPTAPSGTASTGIPPLEDDDNGPAPPQSGSWQDDVDVHSVTSLEEEILGTSKSRA
jgi:hypothetical protein